jgi:OOP family OmpA-OmpF porin
MSKRVLQVALGLALATAAATASADGASGWYFGVSGGEATADLNQDELDSFALDAFSGQGTVLSPTSNLEDSDTSFSLFGGYRFSPYFAVEAGYIDLGTAEYRASGRVDPFGPTPPLNVSLGADFEVTGFTAAALGSVPLGQMFDAHARLGILFSDTEMSVSATASLPGGASGSSSDSLSATAQDMFYGVGLGMRLGERWAFSLDWQQFKDVGDEEETGETDIDRLSLGVVFKL